MTVDGYFFRLAEERQKRGGPMPRASTYWHFDGLCSAVPRGATPTGPVPVEIDPGDSRVYACRCFDDAGVTTPDIAAARRRSIEKGRD